MREVFAQVAVVSMEPAADIGAPGAAITVALCGHWEHEPPCPAAPHHTSATRVGGNVHLRTLFAVVPEMERLVRERINFALTSEAMPGPDGVANEWQLRSSAPSPVTPEEADHAQRLTRS